MVQFKAIADGQLANTKTTMFTCPAGSRALIKSIVLVNTHSTDAKVVNLYVNRTGTSRRLIDVDKSIAGKASYVFSEPVTLEEADLLEGDAASATTVDYVVSGVLVS